MRQRTRPWDIAQEGAPGHTAERDDGPGRALGVPHEYFVDGQRALDALASGTVAVRRPEPHGVVVAPITCNAHVAYSFNTVLISWMER